jgi:hypothetical protein
VFKKWLLATPMKTHKMPQGIHHLHAKIFKANSQKTSNSTVLFVLQKSYCLYSIPAEEFELSVEHCAKLQLYGDVGGKASFQ